jgi:hypothetical protein
VRLARQGRSFMTRAEPTKLFAQRLLNSCVDEEMTMAQFVQIDSFYINPEKVLFVYGEESDGPTVGECSIYFEPIGSDSKPISISRPVKEVVAILSNQPGYARSHS